VPCNATYLPTVCPLPGHPESFAEYLQILWNYTQSEYTVVCINEFLIFSNILTFLLRRTVTSGNYLGQNPGLDGLIGNKRFLGRYGVHSVHLLFAHTHTVFTHTHTNFQGSHTQCPFFDQLHTFFDFTHTQNS
jgi:hypothetical protein